MSFTNKTVPPALTDRKEYARTWYPQMDMPADLTVEREHVSRGPGFLREHRVVELHESRRSPSPREARRLSRSANPQRREMVLSKKGVPGSHPFFLSPSDPFSPP